MAQIGRPSDFTPEVAEEICDRLGGGESLRTICQDENMPGLRTVMTWLARDKEFQQQYTRARESWADAEFENLMHIADTPIEGEKTKETADGIEIMRGDMIEHRRLQVDTRKWALARMSPKKYGDRVALDHAGSVRLDLDSVRAFMQSDDESS